MRGLPADTPADANRVGSQFDDPRVRHFWDAGNRVGEVVSEMLGRRGLIAWDIYLGFAPSAKWMEAPAQPVAWVHQMGDEAWADDLHRCSEIDLSVRLREVLSAVTNVRLAHRRGPSRRVR